VSGLPTAAEDGVRLASVGAGGSAGCDGEVVEVVEMDEPPPHPTVNPRRTLIAKTKENRGEISMWPWNFKFLGEKHSPYTLFL
jgi:hypothetical protein